MWKLLNKLFGWQYVYIENSAASYIRRAFTAPNGEVMVYAYSFQIWSIVDGSKINNRWICRGWVVKGLTEKTGSMIKDLLEKSS